MDIVINGTVVSKKEILLNYLIIENRYEYTGLELMKFPEWTFKGNFTVCSDTLIFAFSESIPDISFEISFDNKVIQRVMVQEPTASCRSAQSAHGVIYDHNHHVYTVVHNDNNKYFLIKFGKSVNFGKIDSIKIKFKSSMTFTEEVVASIMVETIASYESGN